MTKALLVGGTLLMAAADGMLAPLLGMCAVGYLGYKALTAGAGSVEEPLERTCFDCGETVAPTHVGAYGATYRCTCGRSWAAEL